MSTPSTACLPDLHGWFQFSFPPTEFHVPLASGFGVGGAAAGVLVLGNSFLSSRTLAGGPPGFLCLFCLGRRGRNASKSLVPLPLSMMAAVCLTVLSFTARAATTLGLECFMASPWADLYSADFYLALCSSLNVVSAVSSARTGNVLVGFAITSVLTVWRSLPPFLFRGHGSVIRSLDHTRGAGRFEDVDGFSNISKEAPVRASVALVVSRGLLSLWLCTIRATGARRIGNYFDAGVRHFL